MREQEIRLLRRSPLLISFASGAGMTTLPFIASFSIKTPPYPEVPHKHAQIIVAHAAISRSIERHFTSVQFAPVAFCCSRRLASACYHGRACLFTCRSRLCWGSMRDLCAPFRASFRPIYPRCAPPSQAHIIYYQLAGKRDSFRIRPTRR